MASIAGATPPSLISPSLTSRRCQCRSFASCTLLSPLQCRRRPHCSSYSSKIPASSHCGKIFDRSSFVCRATAEYVFPDPIPEFADAETQKFQKHLFKRLSKRDDIFGDAVKEIVGICTEILSKFLHTEYGGPGTLLVLPFIDMADTINERGLPGGPQAARAAVVWAQKNIDNDWNEWTGSSNSD